MRAPNGCSRKNRTALEPPADAGCAAVRRIIIAFLVSTGTVLALAPPPATAERPPSPWPDIVIRTLDEARKALVATLPDALAPGRPSAAPAPIGQDFGPCEPARVELEGFWKPAKTFEYFPAKPPQKHAWRGELSVAGLHETAERRKVSIRLGLRCLGERCQVCVSSVKGRIGYEPSRLGLRADLQDNPCVRKHVLAHEQRHADVTRRAEIRALGRARELLAWVGHPHAGHFVPRSGTDDGERHVHARIADALERAHSEASGYARRAHAFIDSDREALRENEAIRRECGALR